MLPLLLALILAGVPPARPAYPARPNHPIIGDPVPATPLLGLDGKAVTLPVKQTVAVVFFATWCGPCHEALADLLALHRGQGGFAVVLVAVGEDAPTVRRFFGPHPPAGEAAVVIDQTGRAAQAWGQDRFPTTFLVDGTGVIRHINRGWGRGFRARVGRWLRAMRAAR